MKTQNECEKSCYNCLYLATHEKCDSCLHTKDDYATYGRTGTMPEMRYLNHVSSTVDQALERDHEMQVTGDRNILLGPGEAEVNVESTPEETEKNLREVSGACGYVCGNLVVDGSEKRLTVYKDYGPFEISWKNDRLIAIKRLIGKSSLESGWKTKKSIVYWAV